MVPSAMTHCVDARVNVSPFGAALGIFLLIGTLAAPAPQCYKLWQSQSSDGLSPLMMALLSLYNVTNLCSLLLVKWPTIQQCAHSSYCILDLLDGFQLLFSAAWNLSLLVQATRYTPHNRPRYRLLAAATCTTALALIAGSSTAAASSTCSKFSMVLAQAISDLSSAIIFVAFLPQLISTWKLRGAGSLSLIFFGIQAVGNLMVAANYIFVQKDPWVDWAPVLVASMMQFGVIGLITFFRCKDGSATVDQAGAEDPMLPKATKLNEESKPENHSSMLSSDRSSSATCPDSSGTNGLARQEPGC